MFDGKAFGQEVVASVKAHLDKTLAPVVARLDAVEKAIQNLPQPRDGKDADFDLVKQMIDDAAVGSFDHIEGLKQELGDFRRALESLPPVPQLPDIPAMVAGEVATAVAGIPKTHDDISAMIDDVSAMIDARISEIEPNVQAFREVVHVEISDAVARTVAELPPAPKGEKGDPGEKGEPGADGKSVSPDEIGEVAWDIIELHVGKAIATIELPRGERGEKGDPGVDGRAGLDAVRFLRAANGELLVTMSDGSVRELGQIDGKDGRDGVNGKDGQDGTNGKDADVELIQAKLAMLYDEHIDIDAVNEMIGAAVAKHTPEPVLDFVPDEIAESVSLAIKTLATYSSRIEPEVAPPSVTSINVQLPEQVPAVVNMAAPVVNMSAPVVNVEPPSVTVEPAAVTVDMRRGKEVTRVTEWDPQGRIKAFEKTEE